MALGLPPGGLQRVFAQYDNIRTEGREEDPPWQPEVDLSDKVGDSSDLPPPETKTGDVYTPPLAKGKNWGNIRADKEERAQQLLEERFKESRGAKRLADRIQNPNGASFAQDEEGLHKAYSDASFPGVYHDPKTRTEYIKGSSTTRDWYDDFTKVPGWGDTKSSERYQQADRAYRDLTNMGKPVDRVVGHSLGGSVALEMQKELGVGLSRTFGAPVLDLNAGHRGAVERYRHPLDPVSVLDRGATWGPLRAYPHTYTGFGSLTQ